MLHNKKEMHQPFENLLWLLVGALIAFLATQNWIGSVIVFFMLLVFGSFWWYDRPHAPSSPAFRMETAEEHLNHFEQSHADPLREAVRHNLHNLKECRRLLRL